MSSQLMPSLTSVVEEKFLSLIDNEEVNAFEGSASLRASNYIKLANLYRFQKNFEQEAEILTRFTKSSFANSEDLMDIYERLEYVSKSLHLLKNDNTNKITDEDALSLVAIESEPDIVELSSSNPVTPKHKRSKPSLVGTTIKFLTICAVYTGRLDKDEIVQLSLQLIEYSADQESPFKVLQSYSGNRKALCNVPPRVFKKFHIDPMAYKTKPLDKQTVISMFEQADYVVSHNNPDIERRFIVTLFPEIKDSKWYSSQKDIPWRALGLDSLGLSAIVHSFGNRKPRTSMDRAKAIGQILQHEELSSGGPYIERIHYMKPMKAQDWTSEMKQQSHRMNTKKKGYGVIFGIIISLGIAAAAALKYLNFF